MRQLRWGEGAPDDQMSGSLTVFRVAKQNRRGSPASQGSEARYCNAAGTVVIALAKEELARTRNLLERAEKVSSDYQEHMGVVEAQGVGNGPIIFHFRDGKLSVEVSLEASVEEEVRVTRKIVLTKGGASINLPYFGEALPPKN